MFRGDYLAFLAGLVKTDGIMAGAILDSHNGALFEQHRFEDRSHPLGAGLVSFLRGASQLGLNQFNEASISYSEHEFIFQALPRAPHLVCGMAIDKNIGNSALAKVRLKKALSELPEAA